MRITFERSGGFAGMRLRATVQTAALPAEEAREIEALVAAADFFNLPPILSAPRPGADRFQYEITVEDGARSHTVRVDEAAVPATLQPLLRRLTRMASWG
ncbi:MAG: hypothetical protein CVU38_08495 [Chloroflexi bacterium HGW-Chloroflexi-1]|nr:MAG: hypothetical protein CVU38_08495 [Chloroflexi bacterium HGW-Chloroflexi-1]